MNKQVEKLRFLLSEKIILYPYLIGILFITTELHQNWTISSGINKILFTLIVLIFCIAAFFFTRIFFKNKTKAALIASLFIIINFYFQYFFNWINELTFTKELLESISSIHPGRYIISLLVICLATLTFLIIKTKKKLLSFNLYLNVVTCILLVFETVSITFTKPFIVELIPSPDQHTGKLVNSILKDKPNIYFILLDAYTSSESLKKYWGYDNSQFEDSLSKMGFFCTHTSKSDYDYTPYCMASYLNMSLLNVNSQETKSEFYAHTLYNTPDLIQKSSVIQQIVKSGYTFINYSIFNVVNTQKLYSTEVSGDWKIPLNTMLSVTCLTSINDKIQSLIFADLELPPVYPSLKVFNVLKDSTNYKGDVPIFVYAHILMPHQPFDYDENGKRTSSSYRNLLDNESYLKQLRYTNTVTTETIRKILKSEKKKPIIIIQADHGYRFLKNVDWNIQNMEAHTIFSAYLYPKDLNVQLNDSIKPIPALSLLFSKN